VTSGENDDNDESDKPNFVNDPCPGCKAEEYIYQGATVSGIRFFSYVKNNGGDGIVSMTIGAGDNNTTMQFTVKAGTRYVFQASVPVAAAGTSTFTYLARFPGTPGFTDTHLITGFNYTGAPYDLQMNLK
jgi:hypothetical protein